MDLKFLLRCRDASVYPTIVKWKILRKMKPKDRNRYHERNLKQSITEMNEKLRNLKKDNATMDENLKKSLTWMKYNVFKGPDTRSNSWIQFIGSNSWIQFIGSNS